MVPRNHQEGEASLSRLPEGRFGWQRYALAAASCVATTLLVLPLHPLLDIANIVMLFLLYVVMVALKLGRGPAMLAAVCGVASFDFFFVAPRFSFAVNDVQYLVTFAVMLFVSLLIGQLTARLRFSARISASRERRARGLFELTRDLSAALQAVQIVDLGKAAVERTFGGQAIALLPDATDKLVFGDNLPDSIDTSIVDWAYRHGQRAGLATSTLPAHAWHYVPLQAPIRIRGVLALQPTQPRWLLIPEQIQQLETPARQIAIAIERVHYVEAAQAAVLKRESESLRNSLLAAMSHDVRTPLTALVGLAELLEHSVPALSHHQASSARAISREARQLNALVTNLLDMARLQAGKINLRRDWHSAEELVGSAIRAAHYALGDAVVHTDVPPHIPLVEFDAALMERVLVNLLENAAKYGAREPPESTSIEIRVRATSSTLIITVRDHGPGLPLSSKGQEQALFEKFTRGKTESATPGVGLGLAICKAVVEAHNGHISAAQALDGGAEFTLVLPRTPPLELPALDETPA